MTSSPSEPVPLRPRRGMDQSAVESNIIAGSDQSKEEDISTASNEEQTSEPPHPTLENLPPELRIHILSSVPDLLTLRTLIRASPTYYAQYRLNRKYILAQALLKDLGDELFIDVYAAFRSRPSKIGPRKGPNKNVTDFLDLYKSWRSPRGERPTPETLSLDDLRWITWFHLTTVRPLAARFVASALDKLNSSPASSAASGQSGAGHRYFLSKTERMRLLRAFYRLETFCHLFGGSQYQDSAFVAEEVGHMFFSEFEPWDVEEVVCIYEFVEARYEEVIAEVEWDFDAKNPKFADDGDPYEPEGAFAIDRDREEFRNGTIGHGGLRLAYHMFNTVEHNSLVDLMCRSLKTNQNYFFKEVAWASSQYEGRLLHPNDRNRAEERREALNFAGDDSTQPPLAWVLLWGGKYSNLYGNYVPSELRRWGYVLWDERRLDVGGTKEHFARLWAESPELKEVKEDYPHMDDMPGAL